MIFSMFEKQREINAIIDDLRHQGNLDEAKLKNIKKKEFLGLALLISSTFFPACLFACCVIYFFTECVFLSASFCQENDFFFAMRVCLVLGAIFGAIWYVSIQAMLKNKLKFIRLMAYGQATEGEVVYNNKRGDALNPGLGYKFYYKFTDTFSNNFEGVCYLSNNSIQKTYVQGDPLPVFYDPDNPVENICAPEKAFNEYDLKLKREK